MNAILSYWKERVQSLSAYAVIIGVIAGIFFITSFFRHSEGGTSKTIIKAEKGSVINNTNNNNPSAVLHSGIYGRAASDRASIGVFREVTNNIDVEVGGGKNYGDGEFAEVSVRYKF